MKFTVWRGTWLRGKGSHASWLLSQDNMRCCLGHLARDCGITDAELAAKPDPSSVATLKWPGFLLGRADYRNVNSCTGAELMETNDDETMSDRDREAKLTEIFKANGVEVEFKDGAGP